MPRMIAPFIRVPIFPPRLPLWTCNLAVKLYAAADFVWVPHLGCSCVSSGKLPWYIFYCGSRTVGV